MFRGALSGFDVDQVLTPAVLEQRRRRRQLRDAEDADQEEQQRDGNSEADESLVLEAVPLPPLQCRVCGGLGHSAGFIGAVYYDCCEKACYLVSPVLHSETVAATYCFRTCLHNAASHTQAFINAQPLASRSRLLTAPSQCKRDGHTTMQCPHRVRLSSPTDPRCPSHYASTQRANTVTMTAALVQKLLQRARTGRALSQAALPPPPPSSQAPLCVPAAAAPESGGNGGWKLQATVRCHDSRISAMMFHPSPMTHGGITWHGAPTAACERLLVTGDSGGVIAAWDWRAAVAHAPLNGPTSGDDADGPTAVAEAGEAPPVVSIEAHTAQVRLLW